MQEENYKGVNMINLDDYEEFKDDKEIIDIIMNHNDIEFFLKNNYLVELNKKLNDLLGKYTVERIEYNAVNTIPPRNIYQNAENCIKFFEALLSKKILEKTDKSKNRR